ncbi:LysR family transcriptional regulator [Pararoseomonas sp. SCSIO 73927]|uniref:LysR family transcriptional regulator n=1 Tax=Pararoseomonas sp. SCSIO 73927 TaxID=3114537 RepID=UPI0030CFB28E
MPRPTLNDLAAFSAVAGQRSFRKAADQLGVSRSALSHALNGLELRLGVRLLHRTTRSVSPTEAGARLLERLDPVLRDLDAALDGLTETGAAPAGPLRINANRSGARWLLRRVVPAFRARYPGVELDLVSEGRLVDIVEGGFDAGVRLAEAVPRDMIAVPVAGEVRFVAVASPAYLAGRPPLTVPDDLERHDCIRQRLPSGKRYRWEFSRHGTSIAVDAPGALTLDDNDLMVQAAADGLGIAYVPEPFAREVLRAGGLVTVLDEWCPPGPGLMLYYPGRRHVPAALKAFIGVLREANRDAAEG